MAKKSSPARLDLQQQQRTLVERNLKKAIELYGLTFDNKLDQLLGTGLKTHTLTYLYGKSVSGMINILALNSVRHFGGRALFVDAGNSADPYLIRREADLRKKDSCATRKLLQSIEIMRVFTCHQLTNFVTEQLPVILSEKDNRDKENSLKFIGVSGLDFVFSEEDSSKREISNLQYLVARKLSEVAKDKDKNEAMFVATSSEKPCEHFLSFSDIAIEIYREKRAGKDKAVLVKHYSRRGEELEF
jgi:hypothetical protein